MRVTQTTILLPNMRFYARHGVDTQEQTVGAYFTVSLEIETDFIRALEQDDLNGTINYASVHQIVKEEMEIPSELLEHAAGRIAQRLFHEFRTINALQLELYKENPPMGADCRQAGVRIKVER